jgi:hypothetical protein
MKYSPISGEYIMDMYKDKVSYTLSSGEDSSKFFVTLTNTSYAGVKILVGGLQMDSVEDDLLHFNYDVCENEYSPLVTNLADSFILESILRKVILNIIENSLTQQGTDAKNRTNNLEEFISQ